MYVTELINLEFLAMNKILLILACFFLFTSFLAAQNAMTKTQFETNLFDFEKEKGLQVGDLVPDITFQMLNYSNSNAKLSDFRGKLVILDFWATWCSSCIIKFPKLESLQSTFKNKIQIVLINSVKSSGDKLGRINEFMRKRKERGQPINLTTAVQDSVALKLFPHNSLPHYVWIASDGRVEAITNSDEVTQDNIQKKLNGETLSLTAKKDYYPNRIFSIGEIPIDHSTSYFYFKKGRLKGLNSLDQPRLLEVSKGKNLVVGRAMYNEQLVDIYEEAVLTLKDDFWKSYSKKRFIVKVADSTSLFHNPHFISKDAWERDNLYTCDIVVQASTANNLREILLHHLNTVSGYWGRIEKINVKCLIIRDRPDSIKKTEKRRDTNNLFHDEMSYIMSIANLVHRLNNEYNSLPLLIDVTKSNHDLILNSNYESISLQDFKNLLVKQGFEVIEEERAMEMFILSDQVTRITE